HPFLQSSAILTLALDPFSGVRSDWDDTQLSEGAGRPYGMLTHPTVPPLAASLAVAELLGGVGGRRFLTAFVAGVEVECKLAEAVSPDHYNGGFHSSGTFGTFGAATAAAKLLDLDATRTARALGIAASMAGGIRANHGTMTKPLQVGRAAENGVTAALLAREGYTANEEAIDGPWGYLAVAGRGAEPELVRGRIGAPLSIEAPGVSIKPYPCGVLTHPSMDALLALMREEKLAAAEIERITLHAGNNILGPIRYRVATTELEGKFSMAFLLSAIAIAGRAGKAEFTDEFVQRADVQELQRRVETAHDPEIEARGLDKIRSRLVVETRDGRRFEREAGEAYRGGPDNPLTDRQVEEKFEDCAQGLLDDERVREVERRVWALEEQDDVTELLPLLSWRDRALRARPMA
ncbi:MAG: MmgE/PrpD family protein, partial [Chloroflexi bacterium]|nr:MmgE/PrpD family protein [Chloroflexota bacterium]